MVRRVNAGRDYYKIQKTLFLAALEKNLITKCWFDAGKCKSTGQQEKEFHHKTRYEMDRWGVEFMLPEKECAYINYEGVSLLPLGAILFREFFYSYGSEDEGDEGDEDQWPVFEKGQDGLLSILNSVDHSRLGRPVLLEDKDLLRGYEFNREVFSQFIDDADIYSKEEALELNARVSAF